MHRQKVTSRAYLAICALMVAVIVCVIGSLLIDLHYRHLAERFDTKMVESIESFPLADESDIAICLRLSSGERLELEGRHHCRKAAALFDRMSRSSSRRDHLDIVDEAISGCHVSSRRNPLTPCGGRAKPRLLSARTLEVESDQLPVPNIVHFIRYGNMSYDFQQHVTMLSVHKYQRPLVIFIHGDSVPGISNYWWNKTIQEVPNIYHVARERPTHIYGREISYIEHASDFSRLQILLEYGGIYLDHDVLLVKCMSPLRQYHVTTLGREMPGLLANGIIVAAARAAFLTTWLQTYRNYDPHSWSAHSTHTPHSLSILFPHLIHIEDRSLVHPNWNELQVLYYGLYSQWRTENYCIHLYLQDRHAHRVPRDFDQLRVLDNTVGEVMRHIVYGT